MMTLLGEGLHEDTLGCGVHTRIGIRIKPIPQLAVKIVEVAKRACQEEVFPDIAEWPLDLFPCSWRDMLCRPLDESRNGGQDLAERGYKQCHRFPLRR